MKAIRMITVMGATVLFSVAAFAYDNVVTYSGQGLTADGFGGYDLNTELCGVANGAEVDGPYLLWVLTATGASNANIMGPWGSTMPMTKFGNGTFKYVSPWYSPATLPGHVVATYDGRARNAQLTISHGCRPFNSVGAWCSPGFWHNATAAAWALTGFSMTDLFNLNVPTYWYANTFAANPTLLTVVSNAPTYSGPAAPGTSGYQLNAFNATGAFLTDHIPGYRYSDDSRLHSTSEQCPIDHFGNLKTPTTP